MASFQQIVLTIANKFIGCVQYDIKMMKTLYVSHHFILSLVKAFRATKR